MRFKAEIKRDIEKILIEKKVAGDSRSLILNSLVNYTYDRLKKQSGIVCNGNLISRPVDCPMTEVI